MKIKRMSPSGDDKERANKGLLAINPVLEKKSEKMDPVTKKVTRTLPVIDPASTLVFIAGAGLGIQAISLLVTIFKKNGNSNIGASHASIN